MSAVNLLGYLCLTAGILFCLSMLLSAMKLDWRSRMIVAGVLALWVGLQYGLADAGAFAGRAPWVGISVGVPMVATFLAMRSASVRGALDAVPTALMVGLNVGRLFGVFFLVLAAAGRLGGLFPQAAGWGDVLVGGLALPLAIAILRGRASVAALFAWNALGAVDLVVAVLLGVGSAPGSPIQFIDAGVGSSGITVLPWVLIPTVLVPFYLILHGLIFVRVAAGRQSTGALQVPAA
jgi:hypothetical protein